MIIGFDAKRLYNNFTGLGNYARSLVSDLAHYYPDNQYVLFSPKVKRTPETNSFLDHKNLKTIRPNLPLPSALWRTFGIKKDIEKCSIQLYHGLSHELPMGIEKMNIKTVVTIHDLIFQHFPQFYSAIDRKIYDWKFRSACERADVILTISESTKRDVMKFYNIPAEKIVVTYLTCHEQFWRAKEERTESKVSDTLEVSDTSLKHFPSNYLLYVGAVNERKNLLSIVQAIQQIPAKKRLPLVVLGDGRAYRQQVEDYVKQHQLEQWVIFKKIPFATFPAAYQNARALVYPSHYEGFGMPILESQLCGTPVITTNVSSLPEVGGNAALYVAPDQVEELSAAIEQITTDDGLYRTLVERGYVQSKRFAPLAVTKKVVGVYQGLLERGV
ncbi:MAG: glycosyltransferase family 4 protein [Saprospiraceae bacterium]